MHERPSYCKVEQRQTESVPDLESVGEAAENPDHRGRELALMTLLHAESEFIAGGRHSIAGRILTYRKTHPNLDEPQRQLLDEIARLAWRFNEKFSAPLRTASGMSDREFHELEVSLSLKRLSMEEPDS